MAAFGPGQQILESSSGNTAAGLAMIAKVKGYPIKIVLPENVSVGAPKLLSAFGAEIIDSPGRRRLQRCHAPGPGPGREHPDWWFPYQYGNPANPKAHYEGTGPEIWRDCPEITHFVAGLGTAGTLMGVGRFLKERNPSVSVWAVQPPAGEMVDGLKNLDEGFIPPVFTDNDGYSLLDRSRVVGPRESIEWTRRLAGVGVFAGHLDGGGHGGRGQLRLRDRRGHDRHDLLRRRLEVPVDGCMDRRHRRRHRAGQDGLYF